MCNCQSSVNIGCLPFTPVVPCPICPVVTLFSAVTNSFGGGIAIGGNANPIIRMAGRNANQRNRKNIIARQNAIQNANQSADKNTNQDVTPDCGASCVVPWGNLNPNNTASVTVNQNDSTILNINQTGNYKITSTATGLSWHNLNFIVAKTSDINCNGGGGRIGNNDVTPDCSPFVSTSQNIQTMFLVKGDQVSHVNNTTHSVTLYTASVLFTKFS